MKIVVWCIYGGAKFIMEEKKLSFSGFEPVQSYLAALLRICNKDLHVVIFDVFSNSIIAY